MWFQSRFLPAGPEITSYTAPMIESTEATSAGSAAGVAGGEAGIGFDAGDGVGIGFCFSCAAVKVAAQKTMHRIVGKVIAIDLSFMRISSNEFCLCRLRLKHVVHTSGNYQETLVLLHR
jgi:hypothetical protein